MSSGFGTAMRAGSSGSGTLPPASIAYRLRWPPWPRLLRKKRRLPRSFGLRNNRAASKDSREIVITFLSISDIEHASEERRAQRLPGWQEHPPGEPGEYRCPSALLPLKHKGHSCSGGRACLLKLHRRLCCQRNLGSADRLKPKAEKEVRRRGRQQDHLAHSQRGSIC